MYRITESYGTIKINSTNPIENICLGIVMGAILSMMIVRII